MSRAIWRAAACAAALMFSGRSFAADLTLPREGWVSWQVEAVEQAPAWCCFGSLSEGARGEVCKLDDDHQGFGSRDHATTDALRIYARFKGGKLERLRSLGARCQVETKTPILELQGVATDDSARWLVGLAPQLAGGELDDDRLAALAIHRGTLPLNALRDQARAGANLESRKRAVFWLAMLRGAPGADAARQLMFDAAEPDMRKHAAFALAQTKDPGVASALTRQGETDREPEVRAQAWFWLAHTGAATAEQSIATAMRHEADDHVREQSVFALSQLPDERATRALIAAAEDRALPREVRKQAVFWLVQSKSPAALAYLDAKLQRTAGQ